MNSTLIKFATQKSSLFFLPNLAQKNYKTTAAIIDRRAYDENQFKEAGLAPVRKTYRFDPTKRVNATPKK